MPNITVDKAELREKLTPVEYQVTQEKGTERYNMPYIFFQNFFQILIPASLRSKYPKLHFH